MGASPPDPAHPFWTLAFRLALGTPVRRLGTRWVRAQRRRHHPVGERLDFSARESVAPFFEPATLESARIRVLPRLEEPRFLSLLRPLGLPLDFDLRDAGGITFGDTILVAGDRRGNSSTDDSLLFHELVHVVQYGVLGIDRFVAEYVRGWVDSGFVYSSIPLERQAERLESLFVADSLPEGPIEGEVTARLVGPDAGAHST